MVIGGRRYYPKHNVVFARYDEAIVYGRLSQSAKGKRAFGYKYP